MIIAVRDDDTTDLHLYHFLDNVFNAMILYAGLDALMDTSNREKLKKEVRVSLVSTGLNTVKRKIKEQLVNPLHA